VENVDIKAIITVCVWEKPSSGMFNVRRLESQIR